MEQKRIAELIQFNITQPFGGSFDFGSHRIEVGRIHIATQRSGFVGDGTYTAERVAYAKAMPETALRHLRDPFLYPHESYMRTAKHRCSKSAVQAAFREALKATGIRKKAHVHSLRHSYATCLLEQNVNLRQIQENLGHNRQYGAGLLPSHRKAMSDIIACRTQALGGSLFRCPSCERIHFGLAIPMSTDPNADPAPLLCPHCDTPLLLLQNLPRIRRPP